MGRIRIALVLAVLAVAAAAVAGGWLALNGGGNAETAAAESSRIIYMSAVEHKGSTSTEPFPSATPPPGGGYILKPPDATGTWETSTYRWEPGVVTVNKDDRVDLWIWGVNGSAHPSYVEGYVPEFNVKRGQLTVVSFTADKVGTFKIHCSAHQPSMEALLVVLPSAAGQPTATPTVVPTSTPTPTPPAKLPTAGGPPPGGEGWPLIAMLAVAGLAVGGVAVLVARRRLWG